MPDLLDLCRPVDPTCLFYVLISLPCVTALERAEAQKQRTSTEQGANNQLLMGLISLGLDVISF